MATYPVIHTPELLEQHLAKAPKPPVGNDRELAEIHRRTLAHLAAKPIKPKRLTALGYFGMGIAAVALAPFALPLEGAILAAGVGCTAFNVTLDYAGRCRKYERDLREWLEGGRELFSESERAQEAACHDSLHHERHFAFMRLVTEYVPIARAVVKDQPGIPDDFMRHALSLGLEGIEVKYARSYSSLKPSAEERFFIPDAVVIDPLTGLKICIEADEPYHYKDEDAHLPNPQRKRHPSHCLNDKYDSDREDYFLEFNWVVIRFAESQLFYQMDSCVKYVSEVIDLYRMMPTFSDRFKDVPDLQPVVRWTIRNATKIPRPFWPKSPA